MLLIYLLLYLPFFPGTNPATVASLARLPPSPSTISLQQLHSQESGFVSQRVKVTVAQLVTNEDKIFMATVYDRFPDGTVAVASLTGNSAKAISIKPGRVCQLSNFRWLATEKRIQMFPSTKVRHFLSF